VRAAGGDSNFQAAKFSGSLRISRLRGIEKSIERVDGEPTLQSTKNVFWSPCTVAAIAIGKICLMGSIVVFVAGRPDDFSTKLTEFEKA
jgi:hypothetical protein